MAAVPKTISDIGGVHKQQVVLYTSALGVKVEDGTPCALATTRAMHEIFGLPFEVKPPFDLTHELLYEREKTEFVRAYSMQELGFLTTESVPLDEARESAKPHLSFLKLLTTVYEIGPVILFVSFADTTRVDPQGHSLLCVGYSLKKGELYARDPLHDANYLLALSFDSSVRALRFKGGRFEDITVAAGYKGLHWMINSYFHCLTVSSVAVPAALLGAFNSADYTEEFATHWMAVACDSAQRTGDFSRLLPLVGSEKTLSIARGLLDIKSSPDRAAGARLADDPPAEP